MKIKKIIKNNIIMYHVKDMYFISPCRKTLNRLFVYISMFMLSFLIFLIPHIIINQGNLLLDNPQNRFPTDLKYILMWKPMQELKKKVPFHTTAKLLEGQKIFIKQECQFINCYITYDKDFLRKQHQNLDAVVFNVRDIIKYPAEDIVLTRSLNQMYIFYSLDASEKYPICNSFFDNFFNWTWTYKLTSDIPQPLFNIYNTSKVLIGPKTNISWIKEMNSRNTFFTTNFDKTKAVAWIVPGCKTKVKYQDFINELISELKGYNYTLDLYGPCGNRKCPNGNIIKCYQMIEKKYFFQLVLEESFCEDCLSEKMVHAMSYIVIPIILGISDYNSFLPPGSYINAQSFDMKKIGAIIDYLIHYPRTYYHFFNWRNHYYYNARPKSQVCELCAKLNTNYTFVKTSKDYKSFRKWWNPDYRDACHQMQTHHKLFNTD